MEKTKYLEIKSLSIKLPDRQLIDNIDIEVEKGQAVTIIGPNGSGKTTLVRSIIGENKNYEGEIILKPGIEIGYMPQKIHIDKALPINVREFLSLYLKNNIKTKIDKIAKLTNISELLDQKLYCLSGGEFRKTLLAMSMINEPDLLILDEPTSGIDVSGQAEFYKIVEQIRKEKKVSLLIISHDLHMVMGSTDKVYCLDKKICCFGKPEDVKAHPSYNSLFGGTVSDNMAVYLHKHKN